MLVVVVITKLKPESKGTSYLSEICRKKAAAVLNLESAQKKKSFMLHLHVRKPMLYFSCYRINMKNETDSVACLFASHFKAFVFYEWQHK